MSIDLNAPKGVEDYCQRYAESVLRMVKTQDNSREWKQETIEKIHQAMRAQVPEEKLGSDWPGETIDY